MLINIVLRSKEYDKLYFSFLTGKELTRQDINNLFDTFGYFIKIYKGLVKATETEIIQNLILDKEENFSNLLLDRMKK